MKKVLKSHRGITIMALVITIIVLLILASVSIKIAIDGGLISVTQNAKDDNTIDSEKEAISLGYNAYKRIKERYKYFDGEASEQKNAVLEVEDAEEVTEDGEDWIISFKTKNEYRLKTDGDIILIKKDGVLVANWKTNDDGTISNGKTTLKIGDYVDYDATKDKNGNTITGEKATYTSYSEKNTGAYKNQGRSSGYSENQVFNLSSYTAGWRVLGVENGRIQLISAGIIGPDSGGEIVGENKYYYLKGKKGYTDGLSELNSISSMYGQGKGATGGRSIKAEDLNKITGYSPENTENGKVYGKKVAYFWDGTDKPYYEYQDGERKIAGRVSISHDTFNWYDGTTWQSSTKSSTATTTNREKIMEITSTNYYYNPLTLTNQDGGEKKGIKENSNEWNLLFEDTIGERFGKAKHYWLASSYVTAETNVVYFGVMQVYYGKIGGISGLFYSSGASMEECYGIRPVVSLNDGIQIEKTNINDGSTLAKACKIK